MESANELARRRSVLSTVDEVLRFRDKLLFRCAQFARKVRRAGIAANVAELPELLAARRECAPAPAVYIGVLGSLSSMPYAQDHGLARYAIR